MLIKERLREARRRKPGLTQAKLGDALGVTSQAVSQWERGETTPEVEKLPEIARLLGVDVDWLLSSDASTMPGAGFAEGPSPPFEHRPAPEFLGDRDLKVFASAEGGPGTIVVYTDPIDLVPRPWYLGNVKDGFAVLVVGDSMEPVFEPNDLAIVNPRLPPMRGKDVILIKDEEQGEFTATIKRLLSWTDREWKLQQFNPRREFALSRREWPKALRVVGRYAGS